MPIIKFQVVPDKGDEKRTGLDIPIDSMNISEALLKAGIDVPVEVNHTTGEVMIGNKKKAPDDNQVAAVKTLIRQMPQYMGDL